MTKAAAKAARNVVGKVAKDTGASGPPEGHRLATKNDLDTAKLTIPTDLLEMADEVNATTVAGATCDHEAHIGKTAGGKIASGDAGSIPIGQHEALTAEVIVKAGQDIPSSSGPTLPPTDPAATAALPCGQTGLLKQSPASEQQQPLSMADATLSPAAETTGVEAREEDPMGEPSGLVEPSDSSSGSVEAAVERGLVNRLDIAVTDPVRLNGTAAKSASMAETDEKEPQQQDRGADQGATQSLENKVSELQDEATVLQLSPANAATAKPGEVESSVQAELANAHAAAVIESQLRITEKVQSNQDADAGNGTLAVSSKSTQLIPPSGTVQALSGRLSTNTFTTPPPKASAVDKQHGFGGSPGTVVSGRLSKSPSLKSGEASPVSTHDTKNTINVSQLLKLGTFKQQPLKDFVAYEELMRLRVEDGIDATRKEDYLSDEGFQQVFGMERSVFKKQPAWRQAQAKKNANLF